MANRIETIPEKTRWELATKGLTGAYIAISNALKRAAGQKKFEEFNADRVPGLTRKANGQVDFRFRGNDQGAGMSGRHV